MYIFQLHYKGLCRAVNVEDDGYITLKYNYNNHDITVYNTLIKNTKCNSSEIPKKTGTITDK